jgi:hypothetical protein
MNTSNTSAFPIRVPKIKKRSSLPVTRMGQAAGKPEEITEKDSPPTCFLLEWM